MKAVSPNVVTRSSQPASRFPYLLSPIKHRRVRELVFWQIVFKLFSKSLAASPDLFRSVPLDFCPSVRLDLAPSDMAHQAIATCGYYELAATRRISRLAQEGGLLVDVGANYGYYSCLWAGTADTNRVVAFEPSPRNLTALRANVCRNNLQCQVAVREEAVGRERGMLQFWPGPGDQTGWSSFASAAGRMSDTIPVSVVALDEVFEADVLEPYGGFIRVLKIDTEGADAWVVRGAERLLRSGRVVHVFFEEVPRLAAALGVKPGEARAYLASCGYRVERLSRFEWYGRI